MILKMYTVFDSKVGAYLPPFFLRSNGEAVRSFITTCNDPKHSFYKYPGDYTPGFVLMVPKGGLSS